MWNGGEEDLWESRGDEEELGGEARGKCCLDVIYERKNR